MNISIYSYNHIKRSAIRQEKLLNNPKTLHSLESGQKYFLLTRRGKAKRNATIRFVQWLINQRIKYETVFARQETIAQGDIEKDTQGIGVDVRHLRKIIRKLKADGWLTVIDTPGLCNIYILHPIFDDRTFCVGMNHVFNNLLIDKEVYRVMNNSIYVQNEMNKKRITDIKEHQYQETVFEDERFIPKETDQEALSEIFGSTVSNKIITNPDMSKMPSIYKEVYTSSSTPCDDGAFMDQGEPDWLVAAGMPSDPDPVPCFKKEIIENQGTRQQGLPSQGSLTRSLLSISKTEFSKKPGIWATFDKKASSSMQENLYLTDLLPVASVLKSLRLTIWGQIRLSCYPTEAILYADAQLLKCVKPLDDRFKYFRRICEAFCSDNKATIDIQTMFSLAREHALPNDGPFIDPEFFPEKIISKPKNAYNQQNTSHQASTITLKEAIAHNKAMIMEHAPCLLERDSIKQTLDQELEELKTSNPEVYERRTKYAQDLLLACGRDPITGDALPHFDEEVAAKVLKDVFTPPIKATKLTAKQIIQSMANLAESPTAIATLVQTRIDDGYQDEVPFELYDSDPFGDRA